MTPEQRKKIWGRKVKGPKSGRWVEEGRPGNLVWKRWPRKKAAAAPAPTEVDRRVLESV